MSTQRRCISGTPNSPPSSDEAEDDETRTIREESSTPSRGAPHKVQRCGSECQPGAHVLAAIQDARAHQARNRQLSGRLPSAVRSRTFGHPVGTAGRTLDLSLWTFSSGENDTDGNPQPPAHASKSSSWPTATARGRLAGFRATSHGSPLTPLSEARGVRDDRAVRSTKSGK